ncbi:MAG: ATP-binding cassette domain-containing protein, partial [Candidatus Lokiarchaeota archaeon]
QVELFCRLRYKGGIATYNNIERNAIKLLKWCGLSEEYWDKKVKTYSKGMCQRLGLAQVFAGDPEIIFLDEPFSGIDPLGRDNLIAKIKQKVKEGVSVIISSHIIQEVEQLANYIAIIDEGVVKVADRVDKLAQNFNINEFQITSISKRSQDSLTKCYEDLMSRKEIFLLTTSLLSDKIIVKTQEVHSLFKFLEQYKDLELKPIDGSLIKIYKRLIKNEGGYDN